MLKFKIEQIDGSKKKWNLNEFNTLGTDSLSQIQLQGEKIEPKHARIEVQKNELILKDLRSKIGTRVNGAFVRECILKDGDMVSIENYDFVIHDLNKIKTEFPLTSKSEEWSIKLKNLAHLTTNKHPVLLLGPSGVGKDIIAQTLHQQSEQNKNIFISVNCSALTENLIESELFGHTKGSFTGAISDRKGAFETARNGTLFLDEIGDLPISLQAKLLRALENNEIRAVGSDKTIKTNVRIIAATHHNLYQKIREGSFRADLFYRLNVICVEVPALCDRMEDFEDLFYQFAKTNRVRFSHGAINLLKKHDWPGNIRELKNVVLRASALFPKEYIQESHIDILLNKKERMAHTTGGHGYMNTSDHSQLSVIKEIEKQMILKRLAANHGNQKRTAVDLGMPKSTLHDRIKNYHINLEKYKTTEV